MTNIIYPGKYSVEYGVQYIPTETGGGFLRASIDLDNNGYSDFLLADGVFPPTPLRPTIGDILYQDSDGFTLVKNAFSGTTHPREFAFSDFNSDGLFDFFIAAHGYDARPWPGESNVLMLSDGLTYIESQPELTLANGFTHSVAFGDVDNDGDIDILEVNLDDPWAVLYLNNGSGVFSNGSELLPSSIALPNSDFSATSSLMHDIDGDGYNDIVLGSQHTSEYGLSRVYFGGEGGYFLDGNMTVLSDSLSIPDSKTIVDVKAFDIDLDGDDDLVTSFTQAYEGAGMQIFRNDGNRNFTEISEFALEGGNFKENEKWITFLHIIDFNNDGVSDIFLERIGGRDSA
jgi:hypothetical protein